jgi:hypothetical protein
MPPLLHCELVSSGMVYRFLERGRMLMCGGVTKSSWESVDFLEWFAWSLRKLICGQFSSRHWQLWWWWWWWW